MDTPVSAELGSLKRSSQSRLVRRDELNTKGGTNDSMV